MHERHLGLIAAKARLVEAALLVQLNRLPEMVDRGGDIKNPPRTSERPSRYHQCMRFDFTEEALLAPRFRLHVRHELETDAGRLDEVDRG